jgi:hypothetical protein
MAKFVLIPFYLDSLNSLDRIKNKYVQQIIKLGILSFVFRIFCLQVSVANRIGENFMLLSLLPIYLLICKYIKEKKRVKLFFILTTIFCLFTIKVLVIPRGEYVYKSIFSNLYIEGAN